MPKASKVRYVQKFREEWLKDPDLCSWLVCKTTPGGLKMAECKYCKCQLGSKYNDLKAHKATKKHQNAAGVFVPSQRQITFARKSEGNAVSAAEGRAALFIAEHCSIVTADHLAEFVRKSFPDSEAARGYRMKRTKCAAVLKNILLPHFKEDLAADIGNSKYSIIVDESTDISVTKYLSVAIIYHSKAKSEIVTTFLALCVLETCDARGIVEGIKCVLSEYRLNLENLVGIGTDNASVMVGVNNGVYQQLRAHVPHLVLIRCVCHSLQLATSAAVAEGLPRSLDYLVGDTYNWFARSSSRQQAYKELFAILNSGEEPLKIVQACSTRWLSIATAVERVLDQWDELKAHFQILRTAERCYSAEVLHSMYCDEINKSYLLFLKPILSEVQRVNKSFEAKNADQTKLLDDLAQLLSSLIKKVVLPTVNADIFTTKIEEYLDPKPYLGYLFEKHVEEMKKKGLSAADEDTLRKRCTKFLLVLIEQIRQRLPDNFQTLRNVALLSVEKALCALKPSLIPLMEEVGVPKGTIDAVERQWQSLTTVRWADTSTTEKFWCEVMQYRDSSGENPFKEIADFAVSMLVLPYSNAEVERSFSQLNLLKTKLRNRLTPGTINALMVIRAGLKRHGKGCFDYELPDGVTRLIGTDSAYREHSEPSTSRSAAGAACQPHSLCRMDDASLDSDDDDDAILL